MNAADVAYSAGIFDGEGWAIIAPYNFNSTFNGRIYPRHRIRVGVSNTSRSGWGPIALGTYVQRIHP
jgi:hypothetical protein